MNRRILINEDERSRILGLHENRKQQEWDMLFEQLAGAGEPEDLNLTTPVTPVTQTIGGGAQPTTPTTQAPTTQAPTTQAPTTTAATPKTGALNRQVVQGAAGDPYQYKGEGGKYYYALKKDGTNPKWTEQTKPDGIKAIQAKILDKATPKAVTSNEPKMETLKATEISKTATPTSTEQKPGALPATLPTSSGNVELDTWLTTDMGKAFSKITDPKQKEDMMDYLEKSDPTISKLGKDVARPILMGTINADTKLGRFGQKVGQGIKAFGKGFSGK